MTDVIIIVGVLIGSVVLHELSHGVVALALGDPTAKAAGRLTLNPVKHIDPLGSIILPALMAFTSAGVFGWAKPVPISPRKLRGEDRWGFALVALAGPVSNLVLAFLALTALEVVYGVPRALTAQGFIGDSSMGAFVLFVAFSVNLILAAFNLIPLPPLDGSRLLRVFLGVRGRQQLDRLEPYGFVILFLSFVLLGPQLGRLIQIIQGGLVRLLGL